MEDARATDANAGYSFWLGIDFPESPEGCWDEGILNQLWEPKPGNAFGGAFGGIVGDHPVFASIPHQGRLHLGLYQLIAGGKLLDAETMPTALRDGSVVWGLGLRAWIATEKNLQRSALYCDVITDRDLRLVLCNLDLLADKPESSYVLAKTIDYLLGGQTAARANRCAAADLELLMQ